MAEQKRKTRHAKSDLAYWKEKVFRASYQRDGKSVELPEFAARIQHRGRREYFTLHRANREDAAAQARRIYQRIVGAGWDVALAEFKPKAEKPARIANVGEWLAAAREGADLLKRRVRPNSFRAYSYALRRLASDLSGLSTMQAKASNYATKEFKAWRAKVDGVSLSIFTDARLKAWRAKQVAAKSTNPKAAESAERTADSILRNALALFGKKLIAAIPGETQAKVCLPSPIPFSGMTGEIGKTTKTFDPGNVTGAGLFTAATTELQGTEPEAFKAFCLCLLGGLRKREADTLARDQVKLDHVIETPTGEEIPSPRISIQTTEHFKPKSKQSIRDIPLSPDAVEVLRALLETPGADPVFVLHGGPPKPDAAHEYYRADLSPWHTWAVLAKWLRDKGVRGSAPIHTLRKLAGSYVNETFGLQAAQTFLGHQSIETTAASYLKPQLAAVSFAAPMKKEKAS